MVKHVRFKDFYVLFRCRIPYNIEDSPGKVAECIFDFYNVENAEMEKRICMNCDKIIRGRSDKKFCDDYCRNSHNNQLKASTNNLIRNINNTLRKNRNILEGLLQAGPDTITVNRHELIAKGYEFKFSTHSYTNKRGNIYFFCYDFGYLELDDEWILLVKRKERQKNNN